MIVEFIGGPIDGKLLEVPDGTHYWRVLILQSPLLWEAVRDRAPDSDEAISRTITYHPVLAVDGHPSINDRGIHLFCPASGSSGAV